MVFIILCVNLYRNQIHFFKQTTFVDIPLELFNLNQFLTICNNGYVCDART